MTVTPPALPAGAPVDFYTVKGTGHGNFADPAVPAMTQAFLAKQLRKTT